MALPGERLLVGVSGGADSVCLVRALDALGFEVLIAHVNHHLRGPESDRDARFVHDLAHTLRVPFFERNLTPEELTGNTEEAARKARSEFFREVLDRERIGKVAVAHSRDDRTETFLLHLLRGSGTQGLVSMRPASDRLIRPLIEVTREEIEAYLNELGQAWRTDGTNQDTRLTRNRIRHDVLPALAAGFNPRIRETLARTTDILSSEDEWMSQEAHRWAAAHLSVGECSRSLISDTAPRLAIDDLPSRPVAMVRRVLRLALRAAGSDLADIGFDHLERVRHLLDGPRSGREIQLPGPISVERSFDTLVFRLREPALDGYEYWLGIPGSVRVPEAGCHFEAREADGSPASPDSGRRVRVDGESLGPYVKIRNWKNGDTYTLAGHGEQKLKRLFQEERIPRPFRRRWPVLVARSSIVWVASFPVSQHFAPSAKSSRIIEFEAFPEAR